MRQNQRNDHAKRNQNGELGGSARSLFSSPELVEITFMGASAEPSVFSCCSCALEHFSIRLGVARVREISFAFVCGNLFEKRGDCSPKFLNSSRLHFA